MTGPRRPAKPAAMPGENSAKRVWTIAIAAIVLAGLWLRWRLFAPFDISHADELMQYVEQARRLATGQGIVPWEYRYGARNGLIAQALSVPWWIGDKLAPGTLAPMLAARWSFVGLSLIALPAAWRLGALTSPRHGLIALLVAALWWESALYSDLLLSEALGAALALAGAALLLDPARGAARLRGAGLLLGLAVVVRLQYAPALAVLAVAALGRAGRAWRELIWGGIAAAAIGAASDLAMGRAPFGWVWVNIHYNMIQSRAERFGANGPFDYFVWLGQHLGPFAVLIAGAALCVPARYRPLLWAAAVNLGFHSLIAHKEYRFVWLSVLAVLVLAAIGSVSLLDRLLARRGLLAGALPLALLGAVWIAFSLTAEVRAGGAGAFRGGSPIPLAALDGVRRGGACGIALPDQWRAHLVPALLPRPVPLYVAGKELVDRGAALPPDLAAAANLLVFEQRPRGAEAYRQLGCRDNGPVRACLFARPGGCTPSEYWTYQKALEREDL